MADSIFERLGGGEAVSTAVDVFYGKVLADTLKPQIKIEKEDKSNEAQTPTPIRI